MLNRIYVSFLALFVVALVAAPAAHAQKIGYTNQEAILANMPEMEDVQSQLQQAAQQQQQELQQEQQEFQQKMQEYQNQQSLLSDSARARRERELRQMQAELQQSLQNREQRLQQREMELMQPLLEELQTAIDDVAASQSIDVVMRTQALLYVDNNSQNVVDITPDVAQQLGIDLSGTPTAPQPSVDNASSPAPTSGGGGGR
jgi:outer membrane protein